MSEPIYTPERQEEIVNEYRKLLMDADNYNGGPRPDYKIFWSSLRGKGASILGLTMHLTESLESAHKVIDKLVKEKEQSELEVSNEQ
jgi:hypothetical protein